MKVKITSATRTRNAGKISTTQCLRTSSTLLLPGLVEHILVDVRVEPAEEPGHDYPAREVKNVMTDLNAWPSAPNTVRTAPAAPSGCWTR